MKQLLRNLLAVSIIMTTALRLQAFEPAGRSEVLRGYDRLSVECRMSKLRLDSLEGIWYYPEEGLTLAIERLADGQLPRYRLVVVESENQSVDCGSVAGYMEATADRGKLRMWLYAYIEEDRLTHPVKCVGIMSDDGIVTIRKQRMKMRVSVNLSRFLPSVFGGVRIYPYVENEHIEPGMRKIWPSESGTHQIVF